MENITVAEGLGHDVPQSMESKYQDHLFQHRQQPPCTKIAEDVFIIKNIPSKLFFKAGIRISYEVIGREYSTFQECYLQEVQNV